MKWTGLILASPLLHSFDWNGSGMGLHVKEAISVGGSYLSLYSVLDLTCPFLRELRGLVLSPLISLAEVGVHSGERECTEVMLISFFISETNGSM